MNDIDVGALRDRLLSGFLAAWPQRDLPVEDIDESLEVTVEDMGRGPMLWASLFGSRTGFGFDGTREGATRAADEMAELLAGNAEDDRWITREGWREYRP